MTGILVTYHLLHDGVKLPHLCVSKVILGQTLIGGKKCVPVTVIISLCITNPSTQYFSATGTPRHPSKKPQRLLQLPSFPHLHIQLQIPHKTVHLVFCSLFSSPCPQSPGSNDVLVKRFLTAQYPNRSLLCMSHTLLK